MSINTFKANNLDPSEGDLNTSPLRQRWDESLSQSTRDLLDADAKYFLHQSLSTPCLNGLQGCDGAEIIDLEGHRILDFHGNSVHQVGFSNPKVIQAIVQQLDTLSFCPRRYTNEPAVNLARKLTELAPGDLNRVLFAPGGTGAIGMALKLARAATGRYKTISHWDSFHGASLDAISIGGEAIFRREAGPLLPGCEHAPPPDPSRCPWDCGRTCSLKCADYIEYMLEKEQGDVAAVIGETVRCVPFIPPWDYWKKVRAACDRWGALLILDEIPTCLGRTGKMFAVEHYDVVPDMLVIGKGLGGGIFPLAALIAREHLNQFGDRALGHYTHEKSPVACAAALATIEFIESENLLETVDERSDFAWDRLNRLQETHAWIHEVRRLGLLIGVEIRHPDHSEKVNREFAEHILYACLREGLSFKITMGNVLTLTPALTITHDQMQRALDILEEAFRKTVEV